jgi:hypothetical protein
MIIFIYLFVIGVTAVTISDPSRPIITVEEAKQMQINDRPEFSRE